MEAKNYKRMSEGDPKPKIESLHDSVPGEPYPLPPAEEGEELSPSEEQMNRMALLAGALGILIALTGFIVVFYCLH